MLEVNTHEMYCRFLGNRETFSSEIHNIGFEVVDYILEKNNFSLDKQKFKGAYTIERMNGR